MRYFDFDVNVFFYTDGVVILVFEKCHLVEKCL